MGMNIGQAAKASGLSDRMIRYFEKQGLIPAPERSGGGYRSYSDDDVRRMRTIALAQEVGFPTPVIAQLVSMMDKAKAEQADEQALAELDRKSEALAELRGSIGAMVDRARSRLPEVEMDVDWGSPPAEQAIRRPSGPTMIVLRQAAASARARVPKAERIEATGIDHGSERLQDRIRDLLDAD